MLISFPVFLTGMLVIGYLTGAKVEKNVVESMGGSGLYVDSFVAPHVKTLLTQGKAPDPLQELTDRERNILGLIGSGLTNREIGERIFLSEKTIKHYVTNILQKLQVRSRVEAALLVSQHERSGLRA